MLLFIKMTLLLNFYVFLSISSLFHPRIISYFVFFYVLLHPQFSLLQRDNAFCLTFLLQLFQYHFICFVNRGVVQRSEINLCGVL